MANSSYNWKGSFSLEQVLSSLQNLKSEAAQTDKILEGLGDGTSLGKLVKQFTQLNNSISALRANTNSLKSDLGKSLQGGYISSLDQAIDKLTTLSELSQTVFQGINDVDLKNKSAPKQLEQYAKQLNLLFSNLGIDAKIDLELFNKKDVQAKYSELLNFAKNLNEQINITLGDIDGGKIKTEIEQNFAGIGNSAKKELSQVSEATKKAISDLEKQNQALEETKTKLKEIAQEKKSGQALEISSEDITTGSVQQLLGEFDALQEKLKSGSKSSIEYYNNLQRLGEVSLKIQSVFKAIKGNDTLKTAFLNAPGMIGDSSLWASLSKYSATKSGGIFDQIANGKTIKNIDSIINNNLKQINFLEHGYEQLTEKVNKYYDVLQKRNKYNEDDDEFWEQDEKLEKIEEDIQSMTKLDDTQIESVEDIFANIRDGALDAKGAIQELCDVLKVDVQGSNVESVSTDLANQIPQGAQKATTAVEGIGTSFDEVGNKINAVEDKANSLQKSIQNVFTSASQLELDVMKGKTSGKEYMNLFSADGTVSTVEGIGSKVDTDAIVGQMVASLKQNMVMSLHNHAHGTDFFSPADIESYAKLYYGQGTKLNGIVANGIVRTIDFSGISQEIAVQISESYAKNLKEVTSKVPKIFKQNVDNIELSDEVKNLEATNPKKYAAIISEVNELMHSALSKAITTNGVNPDSILGTFQESELPKLSEQLLQLQQNGQNAIAPIEKLKNLLTALHPDTSFNWSDYTGIFDQFEKGAIDGTEAINQILNLKTVAADAETVSSSIGQAETKLQEFLALANEISNKSFYTLGDATDNVEVGQYVERLNAAKAVLYELGAQGKLTAEQLEQVNNAFNQATRDLDSKTKTYDSYYTSNYTPDYYDDYQIAQNKADELESENIKLREQLNKGIQQTLYEAPDGQLSFFENMSTSAQRAEKDIASVVDEVKKLDILDGQLSFDDILETSDDQSSEITQLNALKDKLIEVKGAVEAKTNAFNEEAGAVTNAVNSEVQALDKLIQNEGNQTSPTGLKITRNDLNAQKYKNELSGLANSLKKSFSELDFSLTTENLSPDQNKIRSQYLEVIALIDVLKSNIKEVSSDQVASTQSVVSALTTEINAYKERNNIVKKSVQKKNNSFGDTALINAQAKYNSIVKQLGYDASSKQINNNLFANSSVVQSQLNEYMSAYQKLISMKKQLANSDNISVEDKAVFKNLQTECNNTAKALEKVIKATNKLDSEGIGKRILGKDFDASDIKQVKAELIDFVNELHGGKAANLEFNESAQTLTYTVNNGDGTFTKFTASLNAAQNAIVSTAQGTEKATSTFGKFFNTLKGKAKSISTYLISMMGIQEVFQQIRRGIQYVRDIDSALTELKKVTDATDATYARFLQTASKTAGVIGTNVADFTNATADFARLGYSLDEASKLAEAASVYKNVGDGISDVSQASESIISTMKAFGIEATNSMEIVDKFNEIGNNFAISSVGIGDALQRSASALFEAGNDIDQSIGLITAANSVVQDPDQVGTALKTLSLRLRGAKADLEDAGLATDSMCDSVSTLREKLLALTGGEVDIMIDDNTFKSTADIIGEMSKAWDSMTDINRSAALELMGGKRQANILSSMIQNYDVVEDVIKQAADASGSALAENEKYLDSIQGKIDQFTNALQTMWMNFLNANAVKGIVSIGTAVVDLISKLKLLGTVLVGTFGYIAIFQKTSPVTAIKEIIASITTYTSAIQQLNALSQASFDTQSITAYAKAVSGLSAQQQALLLSSAGLNRTQIQEVLAKNQVTEATIQQVMSEGNLAAAKNLTTVATVGESLAISQEAQSKLSADAQNWLLSNSEKQLTLALLKEAVNHGVITEAVAKEIAAKQGLAAANANIGKGAGLLAAFKSMPKLGKIGLIITAITMVGSLVGWISGKVSDASKEIQQAFDDAIDKSRQAAQEFKSLKSSSDTVIPRFAELAQGVDRFGNNVSLTDEEYKEFLSLNNQIAEMFPEVNLGMNSNGDAMLALSYTASALEQSLWDLVEAEKAVTNEKIAETMPDILAGIVGKDEGYQDEIERLQSRIDKYNDAKDQLDRMFSEEAKRKAGDNWEELATMTVNSLQGQIQEAWGDFYDEADLLDWQNMISKLTSEQGSIDWYVILNSDEFANRIAGFEMQVDDLNTRIQKKWEQLNPIVTAWASTDFTFQGLNSEMQNVVQNMIGNLDFSELGLETEAEVQNYIKNNILTPISNLTPEVQGKLSNLMSINPKDMSLNDYISTIETQAKQIADASEFSYDAVLRNTGYDSVLQEYENTATNVIKLLADSANVTEEQIDYLKDKIYDLSPSEVTKSFDIIRNYGIRTWDELSEALERKTFDVVVDYNKEQQGLEDLATAINESVSATGLSEESIKKLKERYKDLESYDPSRLFEETTNGIHLNTQAIQELEQEYAKQKTDSFKNKLDGLVEQYNNLTEQINDCADSAERARLYQERDNVLAEINDTATLAARYEGLTSAYNKWQQSQSGSNERDMYEGVLSGKKELEEEMSRGWLDDSSRKYLELLSGEDLSTASWDKLLGVYQNLNKELGAGYNVFDFFTTDDSGNATNQGIYNFFDTVIAKQKELGKEWIKLDESGNYTFDFGVNGDKAIADALGISEELVQIILRAARDAGFEINLNNSFSQLANLKDSAQEANDKLKELGATDYTFNINSKNIDDVNEQISEATNMLEQFQNEDGSIDLSLDGAEEAQRMLAALLAQKKLLEPPTILTINVDENSATNNIESAIAKAKELQEICDIIEINMAVGTDTKDAEAQLQEKIDALSDGEKEVLVNLGVDITASPEEMSAQLSSITPDMLVKVGLDESLISEFEEVEHTADGKLIWHNDDTKVIEWINQTHSAEGNVIWNDDTSKLTKYFTGTGYITWNVAEADGTAHVSGTAFAEGNWGASKTETALVGELGPELLVRDGHWTTIGENGAEFTGIKKGDIIFNHKQTESLLKNGYITGRGKAYAKGTAFSYGNGPGRDDVKEVVIVSSNIKSSGSSSNKSDDDKEKETLDFIEIKIEEIEALIEKVTGKIENFLDDTSHIIKKDNYYDQLVEAEKNKADTYLSAAEGYNKKAAELLKEVPEKYRDMAKNGALVIEDFVGEDEQKTIDAINNYREWAQKADEAEVGYLESVAQAAAYRVEQLDDIATDFENLTNQIETQAGLVQSHIDLIEESGNIVSEKFYKDLMKKTKEQRSELVREKQSLQKILDDAVKSGDVTVGTDEWFEMVQAIYDVDDAIIQCDIDLEGYQNSINELSWESFERLVDQLDNIDSELSFISDLMSKNDWEVVDEDANWTDKGITALGMYAQQMEIAQTKSQQYAKEIKELKRLRDKGLVSETEYIEKLAELKDGQMDAINAYEDAKDAIVDLNKVRIQAVKDGLEKELDAYQKLIEKKKEALDADKDLYDFEKNVAEQQKEIATIQRKIAALSGDNSLSATAQRRKLEAELLEAQADLEDTYRDRSYDNTIDALDKESEAYEESINTQIEELDKSLENIDAIVTESLTTARANTDTVLAELVDLSKTYGIELSKEITSPWADGEAAISAYSESFKNLKDSFAEELNYLIEQEKILQKEADKAAQSVINSLGKNESTVEGATNPDSSKKDYQSPTQKEQKNSNAGMVSSISGYIQYGQQGSNVKKLQTALNELGFNCGSVDGIFGDKTFDAVKKFQSSSNYGGAISADGIVGPDTKKKFKAAGYAKGTLGTKKDELALIDELGEELVMHAGPDGKLMFLSKGSSVIPSNITENLMKIGQLDPTEVLKRSTPSIGAPHITNNNIEVNMQIAEVVHIDEVTNETIPDLTKAVEKQMDKYMKNLNGQIRKYAR